MSSTSTAATTMPMPTASTRPWGRRSSLSRSTVTRATGTTRKPTSRNRRCSHGAEFMAAEPAKPKRRKSKPQPASASLFEWALTLEQEREAESVGAVG